MILQAKLLNSDAALNDYFLVGSVEFVPGENLTIAIQIYDGERAIRYIPPVAATMIMTFTNSDGDNFDKTAAVINADDRSMWKVALSQAETTTLAGQNIIVTLDVNGDASLILKTMIPNAVIRTNLSGDC